MRRWTRQFTFYAAGNFVWLLASLAVLLVLSPVTETVGFGRIPLAVLFTLVLLATLRAATGHRRQVIIAASFAVPALVLSWTSEIWHIANLRIGADVLIICLLFFTVGIVLGRILSLKETDFDTLCGAISVYLLLGLTWAVSYRVIEMLAPGSFELGGPDFSTSWDHWNRFLYFSPTTLTTLGYGDITPLTPLARIWSVLEAVMGVLYIAVLIARLVSLYRD